jgi:hypothetical protein
MTIDAWIQALERRHRAGFTSAEFLKAVRALSARYVERRSVLRARDPLDSAGKRAAFAAFYAPLHFVTVRLIVRSLSRGPVEAGPATGLLRILDLGCGTGVASAAWALETAPGATILGLDRSEWALQEARWNWRQLGVSGETLRGDLVESCARVLARSRETASWGLVAGWTINELSDTARARLLPRLLDLADRGASVLIVEPVAGAAAPWWATWADATAAAGGRADTWRFAPERPARLRELDEAAGFRREALTARSLSLGPPR